MACILLWSSAVRVHDSRTYRKMDVTRERISRILELREILLSNWFQPCQCCCCLCYPGEYLRLPKKGNLQQCQNYRKISLISHPSKAMLKIILNRLKPQAEKIIAEEQAGFRAGRSTTEQIFNRRILCEKYLQHQQDLYHVFIDFKAFDRVWHAALWATMKKYNISTNLIQVNTIHYNKATSDVLFNGSIRDWFRTTVGV